MEKACCSVTFLIFFLIITYCESLATDIRDVAASRQERSKCHVNNNCLGKCRGGGICLDDGHCICLPQVRRLKKFPKQGGEGPAAQADFDAVLPSASCSYDRECIKRCKDHRGKCINGECICGGGPKQTVLEAILPSAACSRKSDCTQFCPPKCGLVICYKGACLCECDKPRKSQHVPIKNCKFTV